MSFRNLFQEFLANARSNIRNMSKPASPNTSLSSSRPLSPETKIPDVAAYKGLEHPQRQAQLQQQTRDRVPTVEPLSIPVKEKEYGGRVPGFLHLPPGFQEQKNGVNTAAILLSGAGGGVTGPSGIYVSMGSKLASLTRGVPVLRLDYRYPARNRPCCLDAISAMDYLQERHSISKFVLVGWSFGAAPVFTVSGSDKRVIGAACVAPQTAQTQDIQDLSPRPLLLLHGTGDKTLSHRCSENLFEDYGSHGDRTIKLFPGDDHALTRNSLTAEQMLCEFVARCAGVSIGDHERGMVFGKALIDDKDKVTLMEKGGDLRGDENVE